MARYLLQASDGNTSACASEVWWRELKWAVLLRGKQKLIETIDTDGELYELDTCIFPANTEVFYKFACFLQGDMGWLL